MNIEHASQDLNKASFEFQCFKKSKVNEKEYKAYLLKDFLVLAKSGTVKYELPIKLSTHVKWEVQGDLEDAKKKNKIVGFKFQ